MAAAASKSKKRFGQNFNKLIAAEDSGPSGKSNQSNQGAGANHGLLLLSTGKKSANNTSSSAAATTTTVGTSSNTTGTSSGKSNKALRPPQSQHDALLHAMGVGPVLATLEKKDAWGGAAATTSNNTASPGEDGTRPPTSNKKTAATTSTSLEQTATLEPHPPALPKSSPHAASQESVSNNNDSNAGTATSQSTTQKSNTSRNSSSAPDWDDYGGRGGRRTEAPREEAAPRRPANNRIRELFDPNSGTTNTTAPTSRDNNNKGVAATAKTGTSSTSTGPKNSDLASPATPTPTPQSEPPVIHLNSYEDQNRGIQVSSTPRMLYDPATGGLVAVKEKKAPSSTNNHTTAATSIKRRPKTNNTGNTTITTAKDNGNSKPKSNTREARPRGTGERGSGERSNNNSENVDKKRGSGRGGANNSSSNNNSNSGRGSGGSGGRKDRWTHAAKRAGRKGAKVSNNNTSANNTTSETNANDNINTMTVAQYGNVALYTGFQAARAAQLGMQTAATMPEDTVTAVDLDAMDGELKPTAKEFAPSQAALAAAALAKAAAASKSSASEDHDNSDNLEDDDDDDDNHIGLGFDPTLDMMDQLMSSSTDDVLALDALKLADVFQNTTKDDEPRHIFAFGSSGTWGRNQNHPNTAVTSTANDWDPVGLFADTSATSFGLTTTSKTTTADAEALLIPSGASWGRSGGDVAAFGSRVEEKTTGD